MYHPRPLSPSPTAYSYPAPHHPQDELAFTSNCHSYQQAYPSPEESLAGGGSISLYPSPTLYSSATGSTALQLELESLYHSPIFEEAPWPSTTEQGEQHSIEGLARQHALELELNLGALEEQVVNNAWGQPDSEQPIFSAEVSSYTSTTTTTFSLSSLSPSPSPSPSSPASTTTDADELSYPAPSTCEPQAATRSEEYITLTTRALENRVKQGILPSCSQSQQDGTSPSSTSSSSAESLARRQRPPSRPTSSSNAQGLALSCSTCGTPVAQLNFRGGGGGKTGGSGSGSGSVDIPLVAEYWCLRCDREATEGHGREGGGSEERGVSYRDTLSGVLDGLQGSAGEPEEREERLLRMRPGVGEKDESVLSCDVCKHLIGSGSLLPLEPSDGPLDFGVEVICASCVDTYSRCSDCGGGGGPRLGVGKWRCKELFAGGRKTCILSHLRLGSLEEMLYDTHRISSLPSSELEDLITLCKELHYATLLQTLATPDSLEAEGALAGRYEQVRKLAVDGWTVMEPFFREDRGEESKERRYIALRWSTPIPRKKAKLSRALAKRSHSHSHSTPSPSSSSSTTLIRPGKKLVGFVLGEWDLEQATLFLPCIMPLGQVGDTYEATGRLLSCLSWRVFDELDAEGKLEEVKECWTMTLYTKDPRGLNLLETRRGFSGVEKYRLSHPQSDVSRFSASKSGLLPAELSAGYQVFVRPLARNDDWSAKSVGSAAAGAGGKRKASVSSSASASAREGGRATKKRK